MKKIFPGLLLILGTRSFAQELIPGDKTIQTKWIKEESYTVKWFMVKDTTRREVGSMATTVNIKDGKVYIVQHVSMKMMTIPWVDSAVADAKTIAPVYHSSYNQQRNMAINYKGKMISGYHLDNKSKQMDVIGDTINTAYFDSNIYTYLLCWLPLKEGYTAKLPVYDYNSKDKHGLVYIVINNVKIGKCMTESKSEEDVYIVDVTDGITESNSVYYINIKNRNLVKMTSEFGPGKMEIVRM